MKNNENNIHHYIFGHKRKVMLSLLVVLTIFILFLVVSTGVDIINKIKQGRYIGQDVQLRNFITISGTGEIYALPDLGVINFTVIKEGKSVDKVVNESSEDMNSIIEALKNEGIEERDMKTTGFNIHPRYEYPDNGLGKRILAGYEASQQLEVKIRDLSKIGVIIQKATEAGANDIGQLKLTIDNQDEPQKQAREQAINKAKEKAQELTSQLGVKLGKIVSFNENSYISYYDSSYTMSAKGMGGTEAIPDIQTGENKISVSVNITFEIY